MITRYTYFHFFLPAFVKHGPLQPGTWIFLFYYPGSRLDSMPQKADIPVGQTNWWTAATAIGLAIAGH
jgi:hypothetical protein